MTPLMIVGTPSTDLLRIKRGMLHRPGQDAAQHGTDGKPKTTHGIQRFAHGTDIFVNADGDCFPNSKFGIG